MSRRAQRKAAETQQTRQEDQRRRDFTWLSFSVRWLMNVEDLNNVETAGNYVKHRRAPIVINRDSCSSEPRHNAYTIVYVPAVSGEMIAHHYQMNLVAVASKLGLPVDKLAEQGYLIKRGAGCGQHASKCCNKDNPSDYEYCVIEEDVVEDVAGFLDPNKGPTKRVSCIAFSYLVPPPEPEVLRATSTQPQFHVRYVPSYMQNQQAIYNIEVASAPYVLTGYLDIGCIGCTQNEAYRCLSDDERRRRVRAALQALSLTITQALFGAKRTRFNPIIEMEGLAVSISEMPFNLRPITHCEGPCKWLEEEAARASSFRRAMGLSRDIHIVYWFRNRKCQAPSVDGVRCVGVDTPEDVFVKAMEILGEWGAIG